MSELYDWFEYALICSTVVFTVGLMSYFAWRLYRRRKRRRWHRQHQQRKRNRHAPSSPDKT
jgi:hypothetical protein